MKTLVLVSVLLSPSLIFAQWQPNGVTTGNIYYNNGNVGVGTTTPNAKLDVGAFISGGTLGTVFGRLGEGNSTGAGTFLGVRGYDTQPQFAKNFSIEHSFYGNVNSSINFLRGGGTTGGSISFNTDANTEKVRITDTGNVGIGTTTPVSELQVNDGYQKISIGKLSPQIGQNLGWATQYIGLNLARDSQGWTANTDGAHNGGAMILGDIFGQVRIVNVPSSNSSAQTLSESQINQNTRFTISSSGTVGIGTSAPSSMLDIQADVARSGLRVQGGAPYGTYYLDVTPFLQQTPWAVGYAFNVKSSGGTWNNTMSMIEGNVGIGTNNPDAKLSVTGQVHAQEVKVSVAVPGPDYVFEKDYKLTSLEDIKNYIDQNKHLPEVPSAKEMEKNGVQLGEMNMLLLKKIEELTLYVIELKMENGALKEDNKAILQRLENFEIKSRN